MDFFVVPLLPVSCSDINWTGTIGLIRYDVGLLKGVVVAILGTETRSGDFEVADALFAGVPERDAKAEKLKKEEDVMELDQATDNEWVALVSGLELESSSSTVLANKGQETNGTGDEHGMMGYTEKETNLMLLNDWLLGHVGESEVSKRGNQESQIPHW
jgi:hypothetical protein